MYDNKDISIFENRGANYSLVLLVWMFINELFKQPTFRSHRVFKFPIHARIYFHWDLFVVTNKIYVSLFHLKITPIEWYVFINV